MKVHPREAVLMLATGAAALFAATVLLARPKIEEWSSIRRQQLDIRAQIERERRLLSSADAWQKKFDEIRKMMPIQPADRPMDVYWMSIMDEVAGTHGIRIAKRQAGKEERMGDIYELPIDVREWEGSLDAAVHFLFDLQSRGAMLDVRQLTMSPKEEKDNTSLRGRFTLYCAYMRERGKGRDKPAAPTPAAPKPTMQGTEE
jgi:hypothetical protein